MQHPRAIAASTRAATTWTLCALWLFACDSFEDRPRDPDPQRDPDQARDDEDRAGAAPTTGSGAVGGDLALSAAQASCLQLDQPACAGCHLRNGRLVLRPVGVPPGPPGTPTVPVDQCLPVPPASVADPAAGTAGSTSTPLPDLPLDPELERIVSREQAKCIGLDQVICANCHLRKGSFVLRPRFGPPHPDIGHVLDGCL